MSSVNTTAPLNLPKKLAPAKCCQNKHTIITNARELSLSSESCYLYEVKTILVFASGKEADITASKKQKAKSLKRNLLLYALSKKSVVQTKPLSDGGALLIAMQNIDVWIHESDGKLSLRVEDLPRSMKEIIKNPEEIEQIRFEISTRTDTSEVRIDDLANLAETTLGEHREDGRHIAALATMQESRLNSNLICIGGNRIYSNIRDDAPGFVRATGLVKRIRVSMNDQNKWIMEILADSTERQMFKDMELEQFLLHQQKFGALQFKEPFEYCPIWKAVDGFVNGLVLEYGERRFIARGITRQSLRQLENSDMKLILDSNEVKKRLPGVVTRDREGNTKVYALGTVKIAPFQSVTPEKTFGNVPTAPTIQDRYDRTLNMSKVAQIDGSAENKTLESFKIKPKKDLKIVTAYNRMLPTLKDAENRSIEIRERHKWQLKGRFVTPATIDHLMIAHTGDYSDIKPGLERLIADANAKGILIADRSRYQINQPFDIKTAAINLYEKKKLNSLLLFVDRKEDTTSHTILKLCERLHLVRTQQLTRETVVDIAQDNKWKTRANILLKMNIKMNGQNYHVIPQNPKIENWMKTKELMIVSYDVSHPVPAKKLQDTNAKATRPSVVGFSGNYGRFIDGFVGDFAFQHPRVEQVDDALLQSRFANMLRLFAQNHKALPKRLVVVRDGVSEGQYLMVLKNELKALEQGWKSYVQQLEAKNKKSIPFPPTSVFIVTKRNGIRVFKKDEHGNICNVSAGTFFQYGVVRPNLNEFGMVAAHPINGTAQPVTVQPIFDTIVLNNDERQDLIYYLTFLHQVSENSISLPEPLYQADEWAKRGKDVWTTYVELLKKPTNQFTEEGLQQSDFDDMNKALSVMNTTLDGFRFNA